MENKQMNLATATLEDNQVTADKISIPLQKLFDECMSYISVSDFIME